MKVRLTFYYSCSFWIVTYFFVSGQFKLSTEPVCYGFNEWEDFWLAQTHISQCPSSIPPWNGRLWIAWFTNPVCATRCTFCFYRIPYLFYLKCILAPKGPSMLDTLEMRECFRCVVFCYPSEIVEYGQVEILGAGAARASYRGLSTDFW